VQHLRGSGILEKSHEMVFIYPALGRSESEKRMIPGEQAPAAAPSYLLLFWILKDRQATLFLSLISYLQEILFQLAMIVITVF